MPAAIRTAAPPPGAEAHLNRAALNAGLRQLADLLEHKNMQSVALCTELRTRYEDRLDTAARAQFDTMETAIDQLDFASACACCQRLLGTA